MALSLCNKCKYLHIIRYGIIFQSHIEEFAHHKVRYGPGIICKKHRQEFAHLKVGIIRKEHRQVIAHHKVWHNLQET